MGNMLSKDSLCLNHNMLLVFTESENIDNKDNTQTS